MYDGMFILIFLLVCWLFIHFWKPWLILPPMLQVSQLFNAGSKYRECQAYSNPKITSIWFWFYFLEFQENCLLNVSTDYSPQTRSSLAQLTEKEVCFELVDALIKYILTLETPGAILIFLDGWNIIFKLMKYLEQHPVYGKFCLLWGISREL